MNTCGVDYPDTILIPLLKKHDLLFPGSIENCVEELIKDYYFSEYYDILVEHKINTPKSVIISSVSDTVEISKTISAFGGKCFARLDVCSSKPTKPFTSSDEIFKSLHNSSRTSKYLSDKNHKLIMREYINFDNYFELRCFVYDFKLRCVSSNGENTVSLNLSKLNKKVLSAYIKKIAFLTDYESCAIDIAIDKITFKIAFVIEINPPVWMSSGSALYDLTSVRDQWLLFGSYDEDVFDYPEIR